MLKPLEKVKEVKIVYPKKLTKVVYHHRVIYNVQSIVQRTKKLEDEKRILVWEETQKLEKE